MKQTAPSPLAGQITPEKPTVFVFVKKDVASERAFLEALEAGIKGKDVGLKPMTLVTGKEPDAALSKVVETPVAIVLDRRGRETGRSNDVARVLELVTKAGRVARIDWAMEGEPSGEAVKRAIGIPSVDMLPGIMRTMSLSPRAMTGIQNVAGQIHFTDGALPRRQKEMIAAYVSALNKCKY